VNEAPPHGADTVPQALGRLRVALEDAYVRASRELGLTPQQAELLCAAMSPATVGELAGRFLSCCSDYPPVRLILEPGEGYRLPHAGLILGGHAGDKQEPDVLLLISHQRTCST